MKVTLTNYTLNPINAIEEAACNCYNSSPNSGKIMNACIKSGHTSVTEFATFTFHIEGVSRALLAQITRHRIGVSFAVRSQRYCSEDGFEYVTPKTITKNENLKKAYEDFMLKINDFYTALQELGIPNEDARMILPNACCTTFEVSFNLRSLMHFMNERLCTRAQWEIRELAQMMKKEVINKFPELDKYLVPKCEINCELPMCNEHKSCGRHKTAKQIKEIIQ